MKLLKRSKRKIHILGSGWLGAPLALYLRDSGFQITTSNRTGALPQAFSGENITHYATDISSEHCDFSVIKQCDYLIVCITGKELLNFKRLALAVSDSTIKAVLYTSSTSVYGESEMPIGETKHNLIVHHPLVEIENCLKSYSNKPLTVARLAGLIGEGRHPGRFFQHKAIPDPDFPVNLIHGDDCITAIGELVRQKHWGKTVNICASSHPTKSEFYTQAAKQGGYQIPIRGSESGRPRKIISNHTLTEVLGITLANDDLMAIDWSQMQHLKRSG